MEWREYIPAHTYLVIDVGGPEASNGAIIWIGGKDGLAAARENLVDVRHDVLRLADGLAVVDEDGHFLVHWVRPDEEVALVVEALLGVAVAEAFQVERDARSDHERACPQPEQRKLFVSCHILPAFNWPFY